MGKWHLAFLLAARMVVFDRARPVVTTINAGRSDHFNKEGALTITPFADGTSGVFRILLVPSVGAGLGLGPHGWITPISGALIR